MNRLQYWPDHAEISSSLDFEVEQARVRRSTTDDVAHCLFAPLHYEPNYAYPLLVWLHGPGDNEQQLTRIMPLVSMRNYVAVAPRATLADPTDGGRPHFDQELAFRWSEDPQVFALAEDCVFDCIDTASSKYNIAPNRIFLAGYQNGGTTAFRMGLKHPDRFAGIVSVGGCFPIGQQPLLCLDRARQLPLLIEHGRDSSHYSVDKVCSDLRLFHTAGLKVTVRQYPCGDEITTKMLSDINVWMMELVTGSSSESDSQLCYRLGERN